MSEFFTPHSVAALASISRSGGRQGRKARDCLGDFQCHQFVSTNTNTSAKMSLGRTFTLNTGARVPAVGFGTWQAAPHEVEQAVEIALRAGYRHIDCAAIYRNETEVGSGIKNSGVPRSEIFVTTKLWNTAHDPRDVEAAVDKSLENLGLEYVDLYLMHWPV